MIKKENSYVQFKYESNSNNLNYLSKIIFYYIFS